MSEAVKNQLAQYDEIIFGPFIGELGWEIYRWSGFVRRYKKLNPHKRIIVCTRENRQDLYNDAVDGIEVFSIEGDYSTYRPDCYKCNITDNMYNRIMYSLKDRHPNAFIFEPRVYNSHRRLFNQEDMDYDYTPRSTNASTIKDILNISESNMIPLVIPTRHRPDMAHRNWGVDNWKTLFQLINNSNQFVCFICGTGDSYYKPSYPHMYALEDFVREDSGVSSIGLTIEAMNRSKLTAGPQTASIILSNLLGTPTLFWGHEITRHQRNENPKNTQCRALLDRTYSINPVLIFNEIRKLTR